VTQMRAIRLERTGPAEVLELVHLDKPMPGPDEVLVKAHAIGVGVPDLMVRTGRYMWMPPLPAIPGIEMSGTVETVGAAIATLKPGQKVIVSARERPHRCGCYAEYIAAKPSEIFVLPATIDLDAAAALANYQVAYHLIHSASRVRTGETVLIYAAAGGVGSAAVELATQAGLTAIGVISSAAKAEFVRDRGAVATIDRTTENLPDRVRALTNDRGVDLILDPVGGPNFTDNIPLLAPLGMLIEFGGLAGPATGDLLAAMNRRFGESPAVRRFSMHSFDHNPALRAEATHALLDLLASGRIRPRIHDRIPLAEAARAHRLLESGQVVGKLLLCP
jgi:NADPH:quinone reductase